MNRIPRRALVAALALPVTAPSFAGVTATGPATSVTAAATTAADVIVVTGQREEYGVRATSTGTKTSTPVRNIPQAMTVISERQIEDQGLRSIADVLTFVPGATPGTGESNRDQFTLRGNNTTADFFVDGLRDDVQYFRDLYNVDRVEVLRGSNAMIFGRGGGGGVVNRVTKRSSLNKYSEFSLSGDSEGGVRLTGDVDQPLGKNIGLRVNGMFEEGNSFRRNVDLDRYAITPTLGILVGPATRIDLSYEYAHDRRTTDRGVPAEFDRPLRGFDKVFFGDPDASFSKSDINVATFALEHDFAPGLTIRHRTLVGDYDKYYQNVFPVDLIENAEVGTDAVILGAYNSRNDRRSLISQTDLIWENRLGGIDQTILIGAEYGHQKSRNLRLNGTFLGGDNSVPLSDPTVAASITYAGAASAADNRTRATVAAVYIQDQIKPAPWLEIVAGVRFDRFKLVVDDFHGTGTRFERTDNLVSPRVGLILKPMPNLSLYTAYSRSFLPQSGDQFSGLAINTQTLKPERFDNYEIGAKWEPVAGLLATAALYRLDRSNTRATRPDGTFVLTGAQRSRGLELGLERSISDRWQVSAGYAWQDAEIRKTTTAAPAGRKVALVPRHTFSLWNRYDVTRRLGFGLGIVSRSSSFASISNAVKLPSYTRVDAAAFFKLTRGIRAQVNVENLFGVDYFPTAHSDNNIAPGAPRTVHATLRFGF